ncbi:GNAT family N-acetyltransferase [Agrobacterium tumefaciens]|uniref:GNAT family N-acetyltransferase n=1 Tax=Agrobacterium tumefaciens TaxID=358 RepID=UPI001574339A|nr:GNAT family N-acetyltransferase [Agrobacterium tumefaciens]NSZ84745.1 GNAT family N-acetyltransferase [Agrobacterium tumefaciens]WCA68354.1 GNAT family N-acetyltransferase [Agrobacterium tumefaciens]
MDHSIPTLRTERLILRPQIMADFPAYRDFMASTRSIGVGGPYDLPSTWGVFCHDLANWHFFGHGALMIELGETGQCIGQVGINHGPLFPEKELGWLLYGGQEGHGYAAEAASALRDWAFETLKLQTLVSYVSPRNSKSAAVAQRLGGVIDPSTPRSDPEDLAYRYHPQKVA